MVASITYFCFNQASSVAYQPNTASTKCPQVFAVIIFEPVNGISAELFQYFMDWMVSAGSGPTLPDSYNSALSPNTYPPFSDHDPTFCYAYAVSMIYTLVCSLADVTAGLLVGFLIYFLADCLVLVGSCGYSGVDFGSRKKQSFPLLSHIVCSKCLIVLLKST